jgi:hypothetical protein
VRHLGSVHAQMNKQREKKSPIELKRAHGPLIPSELHASTGGALILVKCAKASNNLGRREYLFSIKFIFLFKIYLILLNLSSNYIISH